MNLQFVSTLEDKPAPNVIEITKHILGENENAALFSYLMNLQLDQLVEQVTYLNLSCLLIMSYYFQYLCLRRSISGTGSKPWTS
jgi:hypothetical protein